jgi:TfoX/Sxy family transcriptional regulator of competence genes
MVMPKMKWRKAPESLIRRFDEVLPDNPAVERRSMFGYPCAFINGNMFCGLYQESFIVRLADDERAKFLTRPGAAVFEPMPGRPMKQYVVVPPSVLADDTAIRGSLQDSVDYVSSLPKKEKKAKKPSRGQKPPGARRAKRK